ncbi:hypothetical protein ACFFGT_09460 [Mucilaginibacter angelicae]|uniref:Knr4/Smi1-like domain-containing protein n=1 Tax=Mucilaginibacter angelicae TaxID=869718 RepID=A0ABV6L4N4_9SPHI
MDIEEQFEVFEQKHGLFIPEDLKSYFATCSASDYDRDMFAFYGFDGFKTVKDEVGDFGGIPDYRNIVNILSDHQNCFVFMEYCIHLCVYAIRLYKEPVDVNEVYVILGDNFKVIANSFSGFLKLYFNDDDSILI